mmetsp:Transcript_6433/g.11769  ORF Transcript_6433/g.11769 Transcript_6433/m.11769 type:complete len:317 (+) Transcript_6433:30-980(+)
MAYGETSSPTAGNAVSYKRQDMINLVVTLAVISTIVIASLWWLASEWESYGCYSLSEPLALCYNCLLAMGTVALLTWHYLDTNPLVVRYTVYGRPDIAAVTGEFVHLQRWTTFTVWSNTVNTIFFVCAAAQGLLRNPPPALCKATQITWELTFPLAFFVNIVVSFVLIPGIIKLRDWDKLRRILRFKPQMLHNGLALAAAGEAVLATPPLRLAHFPVLVLFGSVYMVFAWYFFLQTRIFHYFFLDFRFKLQPIALLLLLGLLAILYAIGAGTLAWASDSVLGRMLIIPAALATCTWRADRTSDNGSSPVASLLSRQ